MESIDVLFKLPHSGGGCKPIAVPTLAEICSPPYISTLLRKRIQSVSGSGSDSNSGGAERVKIEAIKMAKRIIELIADNRQN